MAKSKSEDTAAPADRDLYSGLIRLHILHHAVEGPVFGLGLIEELARHGYQISPGSLYPLLQELLDCDEGRVVVFGRYRAFRVFHLEDGKQIMDLKVPRSTLFGERRVLFSGVLATGRGVTYVVLLRDGAELEGYRVP